MKDEDIIKMLRNSEYLHEDDDYAFRPRIVRKTMMWIFLIMIVLTVVGRIIS